MSGGIELANLARLIVDRVDAKFDADERLRIGACDRKAEIALIIEKCLRQHIATMEDSLSHGRAAVVEECCKAVCIMCQTGKSKDGYPCDAVAGDGTHLVRCEEGICRPHNWIVRCQGSAIRALVPTDRSAPEKVRQEARLDDWAEIERLAALERGEKLEPAGAATPSRQPSDAAQPAVSPEGTGTQAPQNLDDPKTWEGLCDERGEGGSNE